MKTRFITALAVSAGVALTSCDKADFASPATPPKETKPPAEMEPVVGTVPDSEPTVAEKKLASQVQELEASQLALQQQLEDERLAASDAEIAKEQELLQKEREAWALEQQLADATSAAAVPVEPPPVADGSPEPVVPNDYQTFYNDLDPIGSWYQSPDYGYVWQPSVAVSDVTWRPYTRGRWANADQGWTWCSDEPFGWACYHYGRWARTKHRGWVWVPGDQWAPAWVAWRKTNDYIGWCPMPPETVFDRDITYGPTIDRDCGIDPGSYVFMPVRHFDEPVFSFCEVPSVCLGIYGTSINITNLSIHRRRVDCNGPQVDWIAGCVRHPVPRYALAWDSGRADHHAATIEKDRLHIYAPKVYAPWNVSLHPAHVKATLAGAEVLRGEGGLPEKLVTRFRQERQQRAKAADNLTGTAGRSIVEHQKRLAELEKTRESLRQQLAGDSGAGQPGNRVPVKGSSDRPVTQTGPGVNGGPVASLPENPKLAAAEEELAKLRAQRETKVAETRKNSVAANPASAGSAESDEMRRLAATREELNARKEQLAKLRADREAAAKSRPQPAVTPNGGPAETAGSATRLRDETARKAQETQIELAKEQAARQRTALEEQRKAGEAATRDSSKLASDRAALDEKHRLQQEALNKATKEQLAQQRTDLEQQRRTADAASREAEKQKAERSNLEEQRRRQQEAANEQAKAQIAQQRAALEAQRRLAEDQAKAARQAEAAAAQQREAMQRQANEQAARQREAADNQRRQIEEQNRQENMRRQAEERAQEQSRRQAEEASRRQAEEQSRRQAAAEEQSRRQAAAEEQNRRQAEESRRQADQRAKDAADQNNKKGGR